MPNTKKTDKKNNPKNTNTAPKKEQEQEQDQRYTASERAADFKKYANLNKK